MIVRVDTELCQANGVCITRAPAIFELEGDGPATVTNPSPPEDEQAAVHAAARGCPMMAVLVEDSAESASQP